MQATPHPERHPGTTIAFLPAGYSARAPITGDAQAVAEVIAACQLADGDEPQMTPEELLSDWEGVDLSEDAVAVTDPNGRIVAYADLLHRRFVRVSVYGYVYPEERGRGLGSYLVSWGQAWTRNHLQHAPEGAQVIVEHYCHASNDSARRLLEGHGYELARVIYVMAIDLDRPPPSPHWPEGIAVRTFLPGQDERAVCEAGEDAFQDMWSRPPGTLESWMAPTRAKDFDPSLWFLAEDEATAEIAGFCRCQVVAGRGWIATLGVRRAWRNRGIGLALLQHAFGEYYRRGVRKAELSVDAESPTGAPRLYLRAGMAVTKRYLIYRKELRSGAEFSSLSAGA